MEAKDCVFTFSFFSSFALGLVYIGAFSHSGWTSYTLYIGGHKEEGRFGLWRKCYKNVTSSSSKCSNTDLAVGPAFLEVSRTMACLGLVFILVGMFGYCLSDRQRKVSSCLGSVLFRIQEISYMQGGILGLQSASVYIGNHKKHYREELDTNDVEIAAMSVVMLVASVLIWVNSILLWSTRHCPCSKKKKGVAKDMTVEQEEVTQSATDCHGTDANGVEVRSGWSMRTVAPHQVILAIKRLKNGEKRPKYDGKSKPTTAMQMQETPDPQIHSQGTR